MGDMILVTGAGTGRSGRTLRSQGALDGAAGLGNRKRFRETRRATLLQELVCGGLQGIARQEEEAPAEVGLLALQELIEGRAVQLRHAYVA
jgi:hypothetical protein